MKVVTKYTYCGSFKSTPVYIVTVVRKHNKDVKALMFMGNTSMFTTKPLLLLIYSGM